MEKFDATQGEAEQIIWWLVHLLGGRVTIADNDQFWHDNMPENTKLSVDHDDDGNPVLVAEYLDWTQTK